jgi:ABC-type Na+ efflux pump permease subunit
VTLRLPQLSVWPVLQRELREGARRPVNHRLRLLSATVGTLVLWGMSSNVGGTAQMGGWFLGGLHTWFLALVFLFVPALTADCIAREKRDGTLGLLFLTPLSAGGIVAGKVLAQALRVFTLWLAVLPILTISFVAGGVTWFDALSALSLEFCATVFCLAAGFLASTLTRQRGSAFVWAYLLSAAFWFVFTQVFQFILFFAWRGFAIFQGWELLRMNAESLPLFGGLVQARGAAGFSVLTAISPALAKIWTWLCFGGPAVAVVLCYVVGILAAFTIERSWQDKVASLRRQHWVRRYCTPLFRRQFRRQSQRALDRNPIAWLQQYSWKARLSRWGLCLAFLLTLYASLTLSGRTHAHDSLLLLLLLILAGCYSFVGVSGFLEEKRSGALELLLVTPLAAERIIFGRAWGLWKQFLPAGLVLAGFYLHAELSQRGEADLPLLVVLGCGFLTLPVFATYFALRVKHLLVAAVLTWAALFLPLIFALAAAQALTAGRPEFVPHFVLFANGAFALLACGLLRHSLSRRIYSF